MVNGQQAPCVAIVHDALVQEALFANDEERDALTAEFLKAVGRNLSCLSSGVESASCDSLLSLITPCVILAHNSTRS